MRLVVTGKDGQLVRSLIERLHDRKDIDLQMLGRPEADLSRPDGLVAAVEAAAPDLLVNAAAYTAVDLAEDEPELARTINADAAGALAKASRAIGIPIIQISTDYVFDGQAQAAIDECAPVAPIGIYGRTKLEGEEQVRAGNPDHLILRTSWLHSPFGRNFVRTMLGLASDRDEVRVVADQVGSPTSALDLADAIIAVADRWSEGSRDGLGETFHFAGAGNCSWADFAVEIFRQSGVLGGPTARVVPISTDEFPTRARRPHFSVLDGSAFAARFDFPMRDWRVSLEPVVSRLLNERAS